MTAHVCAPGKGRRAGDCCPYVPPAPGTAGRHRGACRDRKRGLQGAARRWFKSRPHREQHGVGQHLNQLLVHEAHVARAKESQVAGLLALDGKELLRGARRGGQGQGTTAGVIVPFGAGSDSEEGLAAARDTGCLCHLQIHPCHRQHKVRHSSSAKRCKAIHPCQCPLAPHAPPCSPSLVPGSP